MRNSSKKITPDRVLICLALECIWCFIICVQKYSVVFSGGHLTKLWFLSLPPLFGHLRYWLPFPVNPASCRDQRSWIRDQKGHRALNKMQHTTFCWRSYDRDPGTLNRLVANAINTRSRYWCHQQPRHHQDLTTIATTIPNCPVAHCSADTKITKEEK